MFNVMTPHQFRTPIQLTYGSLPLPNSPHIVYLSQLSCTTLRRVTQSLGTQFGSLLCFLILSLSTSLFTKSSTSSEMKRLHNEHSTGHENNKSLKFSSCKLLFPIFQSSLIFFRQLFHAHACIYTTTPAVPCIHLSMSGATGQTFPASCTNTL